MAATLDIHCLVRADVLEDAVLWLLSPSFAISRLLREAMQATRNAFHFVAVTLSMLYILEHEVGDAANCSMFHGKVEIGSGVLNFYSVTCSASFWLDFLAATYS